MDLIDLHTHTTASDGSLTPRELVAAARRAGLRAVAVTDHDTVDGLAEALAAGRELGVEVVPGVEISVNRPGTSAGMHMLGLYVEPDRAGLTAGLRRLQKAREERNPKIAARLQELGVSATMEEVSAVSGGGQISRAHFAQVLAAKGVTANRREAFARYLGNDAPAYVPKFRLDAAEAIALLRAAGGVPVLAHPGLLKLEGAQLESLLRRLRDQGLEGLEAHYSEHDAALRRRLESLAARLGLAVSGGSDFHGDPKPDIKLGWGRGDLRTPAGLLAEIKRRRDRIRGKGGD